MRKAVWIGRNSHHFALLEISEGLFTKRVSSFADALHEKADYFITEPEMLFNHRHESWVQHQVLRLMEAHPGATLILFHSHPKRLFEHLVAELNAATGVGAIPMFPLQFVLERDFLGSSRDFMTRAIEARIPRDARY